MPGCGLIRRFPPEVKRPQALVPPSSTLHRFVVREPGRRHGSNIVALHLDGRCHPQIIGYFGENGIKGSKQRRIHPLARRGF